MKTQRSVCRKIGRFILLTVLPIAIAATTGCTSTDRDSNDDVSDAPAVGDESEGAASLDFESSPNVAPESTSNAGAAGGESALGGDVDVTDLRYISRKGGGTVVIETSAPATFRTREVPSDNQLVVEIANARLPGRLKRPFITKDFGQSVASINGYQDNGSDTARFVIQFRSPMRSAVTQSGRRLLVLATGPAQVEETQAANGGKNIRYRENRSNDIEEIDTLARTAAVEGGAGDTRILPESSQASELGEARYYGRPISIEVNRSSVRDVINMISEQSGANIILSSGVEGDVSLKLKQIPWDQALMIVMKSNGLGYIRQGSVLRIARLDALEEEANLAKKIIEAQRASEPLKVKIIPVSYAKVEDMASRITPFLSTGRGKVAADARTASVIVTDTSDVLERIGNLIRALDTPPLQVLIEGKVVEARESFGREFGINWSLKGDQVDLGGNLSLQRNNLSVKPALPSSPAFNYSMKLGTLDILGDLEAALSLYERDELVRVVSSPRVVTVNNEKATISQSTGIPYLVPGSGVSIGGQAAPPSYQYAKFELSLDVTPQVTSDSNVIMSFDIKRDVPSGGGAGAAPPNSNSRAAKSIVMVRNGQTAVVGGIYQSDTSEIESGVPWLRNIPVFGWLFKSRQTQSDKNELLLFLTPRILNAEAAMSKEGTSL